MTALLTDTLPLLTGAPNGIKKLRELILELALRGKLVPQDPSDEPASELLKRMAAGRSQLVNEGKVKRAKEQQKSSVENEIYKKLPIGWSKVAGHEIFIPRSGNSKLIKGKLFDSPALDRYPGYSASGQDVWLENWEHNGIAIIISAVGARCGKAFLASGKWSAIANTHIVWPLPIINEQYSMLILNNENYWIRSGGAQPFIKVGDTLLKKISLPPLAEQHRIVAKVDELMALCDRLEAQQADAESAHAQLVQALLDSLTQASDATDFATNWQRLAEHFHTLFTTESSIDALKQALLQLAVMGKLAPQDPSDEPASELLKRIAEEKALLVAEGKIKKQKPLPEIDEKEAPFELPKGWCWARLGAIGVSATGKTPSTNNSAFFGGELPFIGPGQISFTGQIGNPEKWLTNLAREETSVVEVGDILMVCIGGSIGKCAIADREMAFNQQINSIRVVLADNRYTFCAMTTPAFRASVWASATGTATPIINRSKWDDLLIPIPPLSEQHQIVAKIEQLMALCDQLKINLAQARQLNEQLANILVEHAVLD